MGANNRKRSAAIVLAAALIIPVFIGATRLAGWGSDGGDKAGPADAQALREIVALLQDGGELTYTAVYVTGTGTAVTAVQESPRRAYRSLAALYAVSPEETVLCRTPGNERPECRRAAGRDGIPLTEARGLNDVLATDFIAPELVTAYLSRLAARVPGKVNRFDRNVAGLPTRCVEVMKTMVTCATADGVLAHFESPDGRLTLSGYQPTVAAEAFELPPGAAVTDLDGEAWERAIRPRSRRSCSCGAYQTSPKEGEFGTTTARSTRETGGSRAKAGETRRRGFPRSGRRTCDRQVGERCESCS